MLDARFVCLCILAYAGFSLFLNFYVLGRVTLSLKTVIIKLCNVKVSKVDEHREGLGCTLPGMRVHIHGKYSKDTGLSSKLSSPPPLPRRAEVILKKKFQGIGVDP